MATGKELIHPYIPSDMKLPGFTPIQLPMSTVVGIYVLISVFAVLIVWVASGWIRKLSKFERILMCWWIFTGLTHIFLEGYFVFSPEFYKHNFYLDEVWKEYSKGDSRYAARNSGVVSIEGITAVLVGPAALLTLYAIAAKKSWRYLLQLVLSVAQLYGTFIYFVTAVLDGDNFAASPFYYFWYYIFCNSFWVVIPTAIIIHCWKKINAAVQAQEQQKAKKR